MLNCKECNTIITGLNEDSFGGYTEYCYKHGKIKAFKDYDNMLREDFINELNQEDPYFDGLWEIGEEFI